MSLNVNQLPTGGSYPIAIMGEPGQGKSTSFRNLNPDTSFFIDADRKGLPWRGWKQDWIEEKNYIQTGDIATISRWIAYVNKQALHVTTLVIDTVNSIMTDNEMSRAKEKGFEKWTELAKNTYDLILAGLNVRSNLHVVYVFHTETSRGMDGAENWTRIRVSGKKLESIVIESKFPIVFLAKSRHDTSTGNQYFFETQSFYSTAKTPCDMFHNFEIPNDIAGIIKIVDEYELGSLPEPVISSPPLVEANELVDSVHRADNLKLEFQNSRHKQIVKSYLKSKDWDLYNIPADDYENVLDVIRTGNIPIRIITKEEVSQIIEMANELSSDEQSALAGWIKRQGFNGFHELTSDIADKIYKRFNARELATHGK